MNLQELLNKEILKTDNFDITIFEIMVVAIIVLITIIIIKVLKFLFKKIEQRNREEAGRRQALFQILKYLIWVLSITLAFEALEIKITLILAGSAALLVGVGLGLQHIFQDILSGVAMLFEGNLKRGDIVEIKDGTIGKVREINLRTSKIETRDNIIMVVPNSRFITENVINWSHINKYTRFSVKVGVAYGSDVELVSKLLYECAKKHKLVVAKPEPFVRFLDFGESSLDFQVFFWSHENFLAENIKSDIRYSINKAFNENHIRIPFPQRDVYVNPHETKK
ncbi:mechanosensitive ion channel [Prolixibacteraceae bacterium Z1-6]|uniref:Mechanosensitive ion channel n=1 Tax=Draconibacterium aestuarii TaxID=2998507 RepID=A0A9X3FFS2_9BACT|nr:mechanosensitive ion channel [Prolixibacteraceae bacterium Z1-6]